MKLVEVVLKCLGCKAKEVRSEMPAEQPFCSKCYMPMQLVGVKAKGKTP